MGLQTDIDKGGRALAETFLQLSGIYSFYEKRLESEIIKSPLPNHVAIVLDGNRRWAKLQLPPLNPMTRPLAELSKI